MTTPAGKRRHLVTLQTPGPTVSDGKGGYTQVYTSLSPARAWASISPASDRDLQRVAFATVTATATHIVVMPYHAGVTTKTRIGFGTRMFNVNGVANPEERNKELICVCEEVVS